LGLKQTVRTKSKKALQIRQSATSVPNNEIPSGDCRPDSRQVSDFTTKTDTLLYKDGRIVEAETIKVA